MNRKLELLKRKRIGQARLENYQKHFDSFCKPKHIPLEESENILSTLKFNEILNEMVNSADSFIESDLLRKIYQSIDNSGKSYAFTDDFEYCGIFHVNTKQAIENSFGIAQTDENGTFFILDVDKKFFIRINYHDQFHQDNPSVFDIQLSQN